MSDYAELSRLADAIHGSGSTMQMLARWRAFENACHPNLIKELIAERDQLKAENEALCKDLESHKRMLLAAACDLGAIGEALGADMDDDGSELEGIATEIRKDAERYRWLRDKATGADWEHIGYQDNDRKDGYVDDYGRHQ